MGRYYRLQLPWKVLVVENRIRSDYKKNKNVFILSCPVHHIELGIMHFQGNETVTEYVVTESCVQLVHTQIMKAKDNI